MSQFFTNVEDAILPLVYIPLTIKLYPNALQYARFKVDYVLYKQPKLPKDIIFL